MKDGKLVCAFEEERLNRIKHWAGVPFLSINECLKHAEIKIDDIDTITINSNPYSNLKNKFLYTVSSKNIFFNINSFLKRQSKKYSIIEEIEKFFKKKIKAKLIRFDHHLSHIASSYYLSGFKEATGISIDGFGDFCSLAISKCKGKNIKVLARTFYPNSLGVFYEGITQILGFKNYGDEYKVMGLSAYGKPTYQNKLESLIKYDEKKFINLNLNYFLHTKKGFNYTFDGVPKNSKLIDKKKFVKLLNLNISDLKNIKVKANIASSAQKIYEKIFFRIIDKSLKYNISRNLVLSGGCVMNCLANGKLINHKVYKKIFIPYCPGDNGGAIGSAILSYNKKIDLKSFQNPYTGIRLNNEHELNSLIKKNKFSFVKFENNNDLNKRIVKELVNKKIIAILRNNMEFGSRALGNTSIICDPRLSNAKEIINSKIKLREKFRPFAPAILEKSVNKWFEGYIKSPYMSFVLKFKKNKKKLVPAVCHYDQTGRLQTVSKAQNPLFYNLIKVFEKKTKIPILLNTSFNENEPIVENQKRAIKTFKRTSIDFLNIDKYLIFKK
tara:strand:+ start:306 stop:1967 length:1662 start_codon:yes stop_codon:yes gene_type:complete